MRTKVNEKGERLIWLDRAVVDRFRALRGPGVGRGFDLPAGYDHRRHDGAEAR